MEHNVGVTVQDWRNTQINKHNGLGLDFKGARFELPIDTKTLEEMSILSYLDERCFLDSEVEKRFGPFFWKNDTEKRKYLSPNECRNAWLEIFGCKIDDEFVDDVFKLLGIRKNMSDTKAKLPYLSDQMWPKNVHGETMIEEETFYKITAVCKRLLYVSMKGSTWYTSYGAPIYDPQEQMERDYIEVADFSGLPQKLEKYQVDPKLKTLLLTIHEPKVHCPFSLERSIYRNVVDLEEYQLPDQKAPE